MALTHVYRDGELIEQGFPISEVSQFLKDETATVWLDLCEPSPEELGSISEELGLHPLAVEDAQHPHQRPKLDPYPSHVFLTAYAIHLDPDSGALDFAEVDAFVTYNALVTVRCSESFPIEEVLHRWDNQPELARYGVGYLVHGLPDYVVDTHFEAVRAMDSEIETIEEGTFADRPQNRATARDRVDGLPARPAAEHLRNRADDAEQPTQRHHQAGDELGGDHRGTDRGDRLVRSEHRFTRQGQPGWAARLELADTRPVRRPVPCLQVQGLDLTVY
jgi:Mg2+ and Co2+ transporter CorA